LTTATFLTYNDTCIYLQMQQKAYAIMFNEDDLRQHGIRLTPQRRMILDAIAQSHGHITAEDIHKHILPVYPDMNISTVYRNLERLLELRMIAATDMGGGSVTYELLAAARHHHLICHRCGATIELSDELVADLRAGILRKHGFTADIDHLALWGQCAACRQAGKSEAGT
jgi:Fur family transcriptional regulator, ferric uptake regulator